MCSWVPCWDKVGMARCTEACGTRLLLLLRYGMFSVGQFRVTEMWYRMCHRMWAGKYGLIGTVKKMRHA